MIRIFLIVLLLGCCIQSYADTLTGRVARVTDGDTVVVLDADETQHKIRLTGIDAPERGQAYGKKSKENLSDSVAGEIVHCTQKINYSVIHVKDILHIDYAEP